MIANVVRMSFLRSLLLVLLGLGCLGAQTPHPKPVGLRPDAPTYAKHGPYWVGTRAFVIQEAGQEPALPATLWYPALNPKGLKEEIRYPATTDRVGDLPISGHALADAPPDPSGGASPLVVFATCHSRGRELYVPILEHLASYGFTVIAFNATGDFAKCFTWTRNMKRAIDFSASLTASDGSLAGLIDMNQVAVAGHCDGAFPVLLAAGGRINMAAASAMCATEEAHTVECDYWLTRAGRAGFAKLAGLSAEPVDGLYPSAGDPRVKAIIPLGVGGEIEATLDLTAVTLPTLLMVGSSDSDGPTWTVEKLYQNLPAPRKAKVVFQEGGHDLYCLAKADHWDKKRAHDLINHFTTAFLLDVLKGDEKARKALLPEAVTFEEIQYTTTWK
jgi:predicted dienelactone hydrolase